MQGRGDLSDDVLMTVDRPALPIDIILRRATGLHLADRGQLPRAPRVLAARRIGDDSHHTGVIHTDKRRHGLRRHTRTEHTFDSRRLR